MNQNYIAPAATPGLEQAPPGYPRSRDGTGMNHTLSAESLRVLAELLAREKGAELTSACAVTPEGKKIDLLRPSQRRTGIPTAAVRGC